MESKERLIKLAKALELSCQLSVGIDILKQQYIKVNEAMNDARAFGINDGYYLKEGLETALYASNALGDEIEYIIENIKNEEKYGKND